jgi:hypothetical protein
MAESKTRCREIDEDLAQQLNRKQSIVFLEQASEALFFDIQEWKVDHPEIPYSVGLLRAKTLIDEEIQGRKKGP